MCGIAGLYGTRGRTFGSPLVLGMLNSMRSRGPEGTSWGGVDYNQNYSWLREEAAGVCNASFQYVSGCSRLAINDPSDNGLQPLVSSDGRVMVTLNGEVFNFVELREELLSLGYQFKTRTDTEVLANGFSAWGRGLFPRLNGQYAIAFFEFSSGLLTLVRDRVGITPLYYTAIEDGFVYASEVKAILRCPDTDRSLNLQRLSAVIGLPYKMHRQGTDSLYRSIQQVPPGGVLTVAPSGELSESRYWAINDTPRPRNTSFKEAREELKSLLVDSVRLRLRTDRRFSFIVSGGIDSSLVLGVATRDFGVDPETWSLNIPDARFNENAEIREVLDFNNVKSNFIDLTPEVLMQHLPRLFEQADEPLATPNGILHHIMAKKINEAGYKVVLNGVGGDEALFGYHDHFLYYLHDLKKIDPQRFALELKAWSDRQNRSVSLYDEFEEFLASDRWRVSPDFLARSQGYDYRKLLDGNLNHHFLPTSNVFCSNEPDAAAKQIADLTALTIPHSIGMDDGCYLAHSVEARQPFLDHRILEFGLSMPLKYKFHKGYGKFLLRSAVRGYIPPSRRRDVRKTGLNLPIDVWMRNEMRDWLEGSLLRNQNQLFDFASKREVQYLFEQHIANKANHSLKLWDLVSVSEWLSKDAQT